MRQPVGQTVGANSGTVLVWRFLGVAGRFMMAA
ncbi:hypothetical protein FHU30_004395 [Actinomadura rupiterrae]|nr:hypothetical protein [Actinomadura rupiterrae]